MHFTFRHFQSKFFSFVHISRYGINNLGQGIGQFKLPIRPPILPDINHEFIDFNKNHNYIVNELLNETIKRYYVLSIWSVKGFRKTTLAQIRKTINLK